MRYILKFSQFIPEKVMKRVRKNLKNGEEEPTNVAASFNLELQEVDDKEEIQKIAEKLREGFGYGAVKIFRELE